MERERHPGERVEDRGDVELPAQQSPDGGDVQLNTLRISAPSGRVNVFVQMRGLDSLLGIQDELGVINISYLTTDPFGTVVAATTAAGGLLCEERRDPFGVRAGTGLGLAVGFMGREEDPETGLQFFRSRYHDPILGRFIAEDPARFAGGRNFYEAFENNPLSHVDPTGLSSSIGCDDPKKIRDAGAAAAEAASYCLTCSENAEFQKAHENATVSCSGETVMHAYPDGQIEVKCATARAGTQLIIVNREADAEVYPCGCLEGTLFHEILHLLPISMRYPDPHED